MEAFMRNVRQFLATVQEIIVTEGGDVPREHFLDAAVDGQRLHGHLTRLVAAGDNSLSEFSECIGALSEQLDLIYRIPAEEERAYTTVALNDGHTGRPRLAVRRDQLTFLLDHDFSVTKICELLGVSRSTIHRRMLQWNLQVSQRFSAMSDLELDRLIVEVKRDFPDAGYRMVQGQLRCRGYSIQRQRITSSLARVDPGGIAERWARAIPRRQYKVRGPNALWHVDGNHKLIRCIAVN